MSLDRVAGDAKLYIGGYVMHAAPDVTIYEAYDRML